MNAHAAINWTLPVLYCSFMLGAKKAIPAFGAKQQGGNVFVFAACKALPGRSSILPGKFCLFKNLSYPDPDQSRRCKAVHSSSSDPHR